MKRFKLVRGLHSVGDQLYQVGDVIETETDLRKFNHPGSVKFELLEEETQTPIVPISDDDVQKAAEKGYADAQDEPVEIPLEKLSLQQLRRRAEQEGFDVEGMKRKEILEALHEALA